MTDSAPGQLTRQQLYDKIKETSKDETIIEEMKRLGFWPNDENRPDITQDLIERTGELERELRQLLAKQRRMQNPELALKEMHNERKAKALENRERTRLRRVEEKHQRTLQWFQRNQKEIVFTGENVSAGLSDKTSDENQLSRFGLQAYVDAQALAAAIGISLSELKFLTYTRASSRVHHYKQFELAKKTGGTRKISAPMPRLKLVQYWIKNNILNNIQSHEAAHGFMPKKSIVSNAEPHVDSALVINMDLQDFFPTISYKRVKGYFQKIGYSGEIATLLALLCTESEVDEIDLDGDTYYVSKGLRRLPQGAPTSPDISNLICFRLDKRVAGAMKDIGFCYTRYADDMTFSSKIANDDALKKLFWRVHQIIDSEGFVVHPDKTRIMRKGSRQEVTGIVVNDKVSINREVLRKFKACLHQTLLDGPEGKQWGNGVNLIASLYGFANFVAMVDKGKGNKFLAQVRQIHEKYGGQALPVRPPAKDRLKNINPIDIVNTPEWWQTKRKTAPLRDDYHEQEKLKHKQEARKEKQADAIPQREAAYANSLGNVVNERDIQRVTESPVRARNDDANKVTLDSVERNASSKVQASTGDDSIIRQASDEGVKKKSILGSLVTWLIVMGIVAAIVLKLL